MTVAALREFPVSVEQAALRGELAPNGHVNNIWYFRYSENARVERYRQIGKYDQSANGATIVVASRGCCFKATIPAKLRRTPDRLNKGNEA